MTATVTGGAGTATYQWLADGKEIEGATKSTYTVVAADLGKKISVTVIAEDAETATSKETEAVGVYEELEIVSAEQTGANTALLKFSAPVTTDDVITVKKGSVEKTIASQEFADTTFTSVTVTMKDNFANGTYTATVTPADEEVAPSSVDFEATAATKAGRIEIVGNKLLMKDTHYTEGYFFVKGYNDFEQEIKLTGLTLNIAPSDSYSFDVATGKVTVKYADPGYAVVRNVSVFAQYTDAKGNLLTDQASLEVTTIGYPTNIEFGEIKKDGTKRPDERLTIAELGSNKYYIELDSVVDQEGNELSADDLNDLVDERLLTVIPSDQSKIYFATNATPFVDKENADGTNTVIVPLAPGNGMPGPGSLMIAGAGGSFETPILVEDNPYIQTINVELPDIYENEKTDEFAFSAVDQYGEEIDLYDFAPEIRNGKLTFTDANHLTGQHTTIQASDGANWEIKKDTVNKEFKVKYTPNWQTKEKSVVSFTIITAGMETSVPTVPVQGKGTSAQIVAQTSATTIVLDGTSNINSFVKFKDANGKVMDRIDDSARYPRFIYRKNLQTDDTIKAEAMKDRGFYWTVSNTKLATNSYNGGTNPTSALIDDVDHDEWYDRDGEIAGQVANADGTLGIGTLDAQGNVIATETYYITLLGTDGNRFKVLDSKAYRFVYVPASNTNITYKVKDTSKALLYAYPGSKDNEDITLIATNEAGETWEVAAGSLTPDAPFTSTGNTVHGAIGIKDYGDGELSVKVYDPNGKAVDTVKIKYSDDTPVPTSPSIGLATKHAATNGSVPEGKDWSPSGRVDLETSNTNTAVASMKNGTFTITNATTWRDEFTASIKDQYGVTMTNSTVKLNGYDLADTNGYWVDEDGDEYHAPGDGLTPVGFAIDPWDEGNFVITNGNQKIDVTVTAGWYGVDTVATAADKALEVDSYTKLKTALKNAEDDTTTSKYTITLTNDIAPTEALEIPSNTTLIVDKGVLLETNNKAVTIDVGAVLTVNGEWRHTGPAAITNDGTVNGTGDVYVDGHAILAGAGGIFAVGGDTLHILNASVAAGSDLSFGGHVELTEIELNEAVTLLDETTLEVNENTKVTGTGGFALDTDATATVQNSDGGTQEVTATADLSDAIAEAEAESKGSAFVAMGIVSDTGDDGSVNDDMIAIARTEFGAEPTWSDCGTGPDFYFFVAGPAASGSLGAGLEASTYSFDFEMYRDGEKQNIGDNNFNQNLAGKKLGGAYWSLTWNGDYPNGIQDGDVITGTVKDSNENVVVTKSFTVSGLSKS